MMTKLYVAVFLLLILSACSQKKDAMIGQRSKGPVSVNAYIVKPRVMSESIQLPGSILAAEQTAIKSEVNGRVIEVAFKEGSIARKGDRLIKLFDADLQAQLKKLSVQLQIAQKTVERYHELLSINGVSQQDFDLSALNVDNLKADIESIKISIEKTEIRAPFTGRLGLRYVSLGAYLSSSDIITTIREEGTLKIEFSVPEKYAQTMTKGTLVPFRLDGSMQRHVAAVIATEGSIDPNTRTLAVRAMVLKNDPELVSGVFVKVNLVRNTTKGTVAVPTQAVIPQARNKQVILFHKDSAQFVNVQTGIRDSAYVQVLQGVRAGDTVVISGIMAVRPGSKIKISAIN